MRGFPNQAGPSVYKGFKPMNTAGEIEYPEAKEPGRLGLAYNGEYYFPGAAADSILSLAVFYTEDGAERVHDYLAKGGLLDAKV